MNLPGLDLWERPAGIPATSHNIALEITDLELILLPLKRLRNVGKAQINLTTGAEKDQEMRKVAKACQDAMMSDEPQSEKEMELIARSMDPFNQWGLGHQPLLSNEANLSGREI